MNQKLESHNDINDYLVESLSSFFDNYTKTSEYYLPFVDFDTFFKEYLKNHPPDNINNLDAARLVYYELKDQFLRENALINNVFYSILNPSQNEEETFKKSMQTLEENKNQISERVVKKFEFILESSNDPRHKAVFSDILNKCEHFYKNRKEILEFENGVFDRIFFPNKYIKYNQDSEGSYLRAATDISIDYINKNKTLVTPSLYNKLYRFVNNSHECESQVFSEVLFKVQSNVKNCIPNADIEINKQIGGQRDKNKDLNI